MPPRAQSIWYLTGHRSSVIAVLTWNRKSRKLTHHPPTTITNHTHTHTHTTMKTYWSSSRTITNIANKSIHGMDDTTTCNRAIEMYQRRRQFFRGVRRIHTHISSNKSRHTYISLLPLLTYWLAFTIKKWFSIAFTLKKTILNHITGRRESQRGGNSQKGEQREVQTKKRVLSKE